MLSPDPSFLEHYFHSIYNKLEADALLFNRKLPHAGLAGSENEKVLSSLLQLIDYIQGLISVPI
jgi:hypothetical protein